jgi:hypothetical protein
MKDEVEQMKGDCKLQIGFEISDLRFHILRRVGCAHRKRRARWRFLVGGAHPTRKRATAALGGRCTPYANGQARRLSYEAPTYSNDATTRPGEPR